MRGFLKAASLAVGLSPLLAVGAFAAPVAGYEAQYNAVSAACSLPSNDLAACEDAINGYSGALVTAGVAENIANTSFSELRSEAFSANAADAAWQTQVDDLFEQLLPDSGAIGDDGGLGTVVTTTPDSLSPNSGGSASSSPV